MNNIFRSLPTTEVVVGREFNQKTKRYDQKIKKVTRDVKQRIHHKDEFELSYLRWRYLIRTSNPPAEVLKQFENAAYKCARDSFFGEKDTYIASGMELEDVCSIAQVHLVSYLGLYSIEHVPDQMEKFVNKYEKTNGKKPDEKEIKRKNLSNMICFISQRLRDLIRICKQKNRNITGENVTYEIYKLTGKEKECSDWALSLSPESYGFEKISRAEKIKVGSHIIRDAAMERVEHKGRVYRVISDVTGVTWLSNHNDPSNLPIFNPQDKILNPEEIEDFKLKHRKEKLLDRYQEASPKNKIRILKRIVRFLSKKEGFEQEVELAKTLLLEVQNG